MARLLLEAGAVQVSHDRPFVLAAGWASPVYVDCRRLLGMPHLRAGAIALALDYLRQRFGAAPPFDAVAGGETAGIPWASWIADRLGLPLLYVRKRPLGIGRHAQVEGGAPEGSRVLLVDDLATDAASKVAFAQGLRTAGMRLSDALVLFHNRAFPGWDARLEHLGLSLHALASWDDVLRPEAGETLLSPADRDVIERFLRDPAGWSADHGGRRAPMTPPR
ncbi:orotate phosphoribosyltransferase [Roseomonas sp. NAR14]|uniref:Orotate phosphoribosyltransferase n=1 Tax=Roseomonas acroporae TaxID=2937791 RepID=A0A9X2BXH9_9PROT|nr:orotate phosphoribosyltransferase [Roseomonas acroporae]MCK8785984.1 orotate phosphoribosyltransferase [Roseomonas acroporae]